MGEQRAKLRLGRIDFLNVLPIYYPLEAGIIANPFAIVPGVPSELNELCANGALDISPVSSIEYARRAGLYYIVPDLSINSAGEVKSVLLLSRMPIERLSGKTVLASLGIAYFGRAAESPVQVAIRGGSPVRNGVLFGLSFRARTPRCVPCNW